MKAVQIVNPGKNSKLEIRDIPAPEPGDRELLVKIEATALNRADLHQRAGNYPPPEGAPDILGLEMAGIVEACGVEVDHWEPGDLVFGLLPGGGYAEYCVIHEDLAIPLPDNLTFEEASGIPETFLTAYQALTWLGNLQQNETVLIHAGGSGVGTSAIQLSRHLFDARIATTAGKERKLERCRELGAELAVNYQKEDFADEITSVFGKEPVNLIIDFIGAPYWHKNIDILATDGRLVYLSFLGGHRLENFSLAPFLKKRLTVKGSTLRSRSIGYKIKLTQDFWNKTSGYFEKGVLKPVIDTIYGWEEVEEAHKRMADDQNTGKIILTGM